jgi:cellulose synthase/poly-beta-1,6-N-acetylglucosamine synthase-like glycosyltransferase
MVMSMSINIFKNIGFDLVFTGSGRFLTHLNRMELWNARIKLLSKWLDVFCKPKTFLLTFGLKLYIVETIYSIAYQLELFLPFLQSKDGVEISLQLTTSICLDVFPKSIFPMIVEITYVQIIMLAS